MAQSQTSGSLKTSGSCRKQFRKTLQFCYTLLQHEFLEKRDSQNESACSPWTGKACEMKKGKKEPE
jgi:hypothetical protein